MTEIVWLGKQIVIFPWFAISLLQNHKLAVVWRPLSLFSGIFISMLLYEVFFQSFGQEIHSSPTRWSAESKGKIIVIAMTQTMI